MQQKHFDFSLQPVLSSDDFLVTPVNEGAYLAVQSWPNWDSYAVFVYGPTGCGKSHLAHVFQERTQAVYVDAKGLMAKTPPEIYAHTPCCIIDSIQKVLPYQKQLFHLLNYTKEFKKSLLITSNVPPAQLKLSLLDLNSRFKAIPSYEIAAPDQDLLHMVLVKQFSDRQLRVPNAVIDFLLTRMKRSFADIKLLVEQIDKTAMYEKRAITVPFVKEVLERMEAV